jgi:hypothetical protein
MDDRQFDALARTLGEGRSRRGLLKTVGVAALGAIGVISFSNEAAARAEKVGICHRTGSQSNPFQYISVSVNALDAHIAHGDIVTDLSDAANCGSCGNACAAGEVCNGGVCIPSCSPDDPIFMDNTPC